MSQTDCKHKSFSFETTTVSGLGYKIGIVRCSQCGTAIGTFIPQIPDALNAIGGKLVLREVLKCLSNRESSPII